VGKALARRVDENTTPMVRAWNNMVVEERILEGEKSVEDLKRVTRFAKKTDESNGQKRPGGTQKLYKGGEC
jgi:hypothetical protein